MYIWTWGWDFGERRARGLTLLWIVTSIAKSHPVLGFPEICELANFRDWGRGGALAEG